jgi:protein-disulfide isomerase
MDVARPARPDPNRRYAVSTKGAPVKGSPDAPLVIVEFSDFQCPFCSRVTPTLRQIEREYGEKIRIVFKHLPLTMHPKAPGAHAAAEAAHRQGRFWEMHDRIFANQREMSEEKYIEYAEQIGLDLEQFEADVASADIKKRIAEDMAEARRLGVTGTPGFFVNGRLLSGAQPFEAFEALIEAPGGLPESSKPRIPPTENRPPLRRSRPPQPKLG